MNTLVCQKMNINFFIIVHDCGEDLYLDWDDLILRDREGYRVYLYDVTLKYVDEDKQIHEVEYE